MEVPIFVIGENFCDQLLRFLKNRRNADIDIKYDFLFQVIMDNLNCTDEGNEQEMALYNSASWWLECVAELSIGVMGLLGNGVAIFLLRSDRLASTFNRLLIGLCVVDNLFILSCCLEAVRRFVGTSNFHELAFIYFLYQLQSISLSCSINMTVVLAIER